MVHQCEIDRFRHRAGRSPSMGCSRNSRKFARDEQCFAYSSANKIRVVGSELRSSYTPNGVHSEVSGVVVSDLNSTQQNYQVQVAATSWSKIASMFTAITARAPTLTEQKYWFLKGTDSGYTTSQIQTEMKTTLSPTASPTPTTSPAPTATPSTGSCSFGGRTIANGVAVIAYQQGGLPSGYNCNAAGYYQIRICSNGVLSGTYLNPTCTVSGNTGASCSFSGRTIPHANATIAYQQGNLPQGYNCNALPYYQIRTCSNGALSGTYTQPSCRIQ
jgi:hypothetical protein